jgi:hypothetical protein
MRFLIALALLSCTTSTFAAAPQAAPPGGITAQKAFPIAVWLQDPKNAPAYKALGINLYVGLWEGPTESQLTALEKAGMPVLCEQNAEGLKPRWNQEIVGWTQDDEPDNAQSLGEGKGYGPPVLPEKVVERYQAMKKADATRPVILNLGQGVAWDEWFGRGVRTNKPEDYPFYVKGGDILSFDIYPVTHDNKAVAGKLEFVARGTQRLRQWTDPAKPVWACIECTHISNADKKPTPEQVKAEVWMAIIHGAGGIMYFAHQFAPRFVEAGLLEDAAMCKAITQTNQQIQELAPVIYSLPPADGATFSTDGVALLTRRQGGATYVFAVGMSGAPVTGTISLKGAAGAVEVLGEQRQIAANAGSWSDTFSGYQVHLYRIGP